MRQCRAGSSSQLFRTSPGMAWACSPSSSMEHGGKVKHRGRGLSGACFVPPEPHHLSLMHYMHHMRVASHRCEVAAAPAGASTLAGSCEW